MKKLLYLFLTVLIVACSGEDGGNDNNSNDEDNNDGDNTVLTCSGDNPVYLADNGVTIKACDFANVGDTGVINGITYTVVDEAMLREMVENEQDVTKLATTKVTDMKLMFYENSTFNQPIGNWDVSNVTNMGGMFTIATSFNQPIGNWDMSNVTNMAYMFGDATSYNQDLSSWSVDGVTQCLQFSDGANSWTLPQPNFTNCTP